MIGFHSQALLSKGVLRYGNKRLPRRSHCEDFAELKEITVSINSFVFLSFYVRTECFQKCPQGVTPSPNASIFQSERGGSNSVSLITITGHCFPLGQKQLFLPIRVRTRRVRAHFGQSNISFFQQKRKKELLLILIIFAYFKVQKKREKKKMVGKIDHFFIFLILKLNSKIQKILLTAKSDILLFFILLLLLENEKNEIISDS